MKQFYCYLYKVNGIYRYIGKGQKHRVVDHLKHRDGTLKSRHNKAFISHLRNQKELGIEPEIEVIFCESEQEAHDIEMTYIAEIGRLCTGDGPLFNITLGGEGVSGYIHTDEELVKMREASLGENNAFFGEKHTDDAKAKMSAWRKGKTPWNKGVPMTEEQKAKSSAGHMGQVAWNKGISMSDEQVAKNSASHIGRNISFINAAGDIKKFNLGDIIPEGYNFKVKYAPRDLKYAISPMRELVSIKKS